MAYRYPMHAIAMTLALGRGEDLRDDAMSGTAVPTDDAFFAAALPIIDSACHDYVPPGV